MELSINFNNFLEFESWIYIILYYNNIEMSTVIRSLLYINKILFVFY